MSGDLQFNKIAGAGLATVFTILVVNTIADGVYHQEAPEKMGYHVEVAEAGGGAAEAELPPDWGTVLPAADLAAGEQAFARCATCHTINQGGANGTGPNLFGIVGNRVTHAAGFSYSAAMQAHAAEAPTWGYDELDQFITNPGRYVSGTAMTFGGLRNTEERINLIAYLRSQGSTNYPIPAPDPARQPGAAAAAEGDAAVAEAAAGDDTTAADPAAVSDVQATEPGATN
ncbi:c-type cytochrome [Brevundimonas aveniformis]|uniref:c-type cytochrome n=1 Tax=Brevundimonas aveniformis TaxID=370977 RepID=UPI000405D519|nr:cytochrome c family protein [Brevundimonas aveniformis]